jgi:hypothetical protein
VQINVSAQSLGSPASTQSGLGVLPAVFLRATSARRGHTVAPNAIHRSHTKFLLNGSGRGAGRR